MEDLEHFVIVDFWRSQVAGVSQTGKPQWFSFPRAYEITRTMRYRDMVFAAEDRRYLETLEKTYKRVVNRFSSVISLR
jgi:hypothetical protein